MKPLSDHQLALYAELQLAPYQVMWLSRAVPS